MTRLRMPARWWILLLGTVAVAGHVMLPLIVAHVSTSAAVMSAVVVAVIVAKHLGFAAAVGRWCSTARDRQSIRIQNLPRTEGVVRRRHRSLARRSEGEREAGRRQCSVASHLRD